MEALPLLGQDRVLRPLLAAARADRLHHAYLFEGPDGVGKGAAARWLARAAACEVSSEGRPCGRCGTCRQFAAGTHPDLVVLRPDPKRASGTISVEQVRELIRSVGLRRYNARWRTVIVDPVDKLMPQAANALLKTLEEPPRGTGFVLLTSRTSALLPTVISRCQRIRFRAVPESELAAWLEERGVHDAVRLARRARGSVARALALAEEDGSGDELRDELVAALKGGAAGQQAFAERVAKGKRADVQLRIEALLEVLETLLVDTVRVGSGSDVGLVHDDREDLVRAWAPRLFPRGIDRMREEIDQTRQRMEVNVNTRLMVECLVARLAEQLRG